MLTRHGLSRLSLPLIAAVLAALSCNLPRPLVPFLARETEQERVWKAENTLVPALAATLVDDEGHVLSLELVDGTKWTCKDVDGAVSEMKRNTDTSDTMNLGGADVQLTMIYLPYSGGLRITYLDHFAVDSAVLDGATGEVMAWDKNTSSASGEARGIMLVEKRIFSGTLTAYETRRSTYPTEVTSLVEETHNFFGLVSPEDYRRAYFCDLRNIPVPAELGNLTPENFRDHCPLHYYECEAD